MWILKYFKYLIEHIQSKPLSSCNSVNTFDFSTLYRSPANVKLKDKLITLVLLCFIIRRIKIDTNIKGRDKSFFVKNKCNTKKNNHIQIKTSLKTTLSRYLNSWLTSYFLRLEDVIFIKQSFFFIWTNGVPLLVDLLPYSWRLTSYRSFFARTKRS